MNNPQWEEFSSLLSRLMEKQREEEDQLILFCNDQLRRALSLHQAQNSATLLKNISLNASEILKQKDIQISAANLKTQELELSLQITTQTLNTYKNIVNDQITTISSLEETLKQINGPCLSSNGSRTKPTARVTSSNGSGSKPTSRFTSSNRSGSRPMARFACKFCLTRGACMVINPCGHLCACEVCEAVIELCPVCFAVKKGSIEVLFGKEEL